MVEATRLATASASTRSRSVYTRAESVLTSWIAPMTRPRLSIGTAMALWRRRPRTTSRASSVASACSIIFQSISGRNSLSPVRITAGTPVGKSGS